MMNDNVGNKSLGEQNREVNEGLGSESSTGNDTRFSKVTKEGNNGLKGSSQIHERFQVSPQPLPRAPVTYWERFLPVTSIKVLLVDDDDSTRNVVCALLKNCGYEVTAVSNGLQAWKVLEDPGNRIDLVLTEVAMPFVSGIGLLCKIMSHIALKNIPVIMMSSHDSMGIVFKCLSKGAADFLVKPIRRNELKNLWQHVWRRCHSSSDSGSESGTNTRKFAKSRSICAYDNNSGSSDENDYGSRGLSVRDGSDKGSGTQSSWTTNLAQISSSPHPVSPHKQSHDTPDSTCAQVVLPKPENISSSKWDQATEKECHKPIDHPDDIAMGKDLAMGISLNMQEKHPHEELSNNPMCKGVNKMSDTDGMQLNKGHSSVREKVQPEEDSDRTRMQENQAMNVGVTDSSSPQAESRDLNTSNGFSGFAKTKTSCFKQHPSLELTLKRMGEVKDAEHVTGDECNVLRHSDLSAFSKYNTASAYQAQTGNVGSCSPLDNSSVSPNTETIQNFTSHSNATLPNQQSNGSNNMNDLASTNTYLSTKPENFEKKPESSKGIGSFTSSELQIVQNNSVSTSQKKTSAQEECAGSIKGQVGGFEQGFQVEHAQHQLQHCNRIAHKEAVDLRSVHDILVESTTKDDQQCMSNAFGEPAESNGTATNYGKDGSAAESDHGSNGQDGSNTLTIGMINMRNSNVEAGSFGISGIDKVNIGSGSYEQRFALREAALLKFRLKRKERCFEKKVRYQSRKKLADQRPRVRGQFVKQIVYGTNEENKESEELVSMDNSNDDPKQHQPNC
ncbi:two-component response regulator-like APRR3 [Vicia villosa]|uniref:two-component response regulator-like APRR3 n=1 Tax=Vicia villosa TaxID=3911 RepID=UPI00273A9E53|nr:two-component response regulator-like APRR3 [Vicia villosa]